MRIPLSCFLVEDVRSPHAWYGASFLDMSLSPDGISGIAADQYDTVDEHYGREPPGVD